MVLVVAEQRDGILSRASWEVVAAAQQLAGGAPVKVAILGAAVEPAARELAGADVAEVLQVEAAALEPYTPDGFVQALAALLEAEPPRLVLFPHTYQARDFVPRLAARLDRALATDCVAVRLEADGVVVVRPMFQGKLSAEVLLLGPPPYLVTVQIGAYRADQLRRATTAAPLRRVVAAVDPAAIRQRPEPPFREAKQAVDLSQAERIVAVGRGIKSQEHLELARKLAAVLGAELGASRPICDAGWLPMDRQIGSSGQTVAPKLYVALGISGAIQHLVGMKGSRTVVAINKDPDAPIFEVADYGIVGDLFEVVPALIDALHQSPVR
jgi:electron transfer flavoprotein alpha subunit